MLFNKLILPQIFNSINKFNEVTAKNIYKIEYPNFSLRYCRTEDTLHSFYGEYCYNCYYLKEPNLLISERDFGEFKEHFGGAFPLKLIEILDTWPKKNNFPFIHDTQINSLAEHEKLVSLFTDWKRLNKEIKVNEILDLYSIQKEYHKKFQEVQATKEKLI